MADDYDDYDDDGGESGGSLGRAAGAYNSVWVDATLLVMLGGAYAAALCIIVPWVVALKVLPDVLVLNIGATADYFISASGIFIGFLLASVLRNIRTSVNARAAAMREMLYLITTTANLHTALSGRDDAEHDVVRALLASLTQTAFALVHNDTGQGAILFGDDRVVSKAQPARTRVWKCPLLVPSGRHVGVTNLGNALMLSRTSNKGVNAAWIGSRQAPELDSDRTGSCLPPVERLFDAHLNILTRHFTGAHAPPGSRGGMLAASLAPLRTAGLRVATNSASPPSAFTYFVRTTVAVHALILAPYLAARLGWDALFVYPPLALVLSGYFVVRYWVRWRQHSKAPLYDTRRWTADTIRHIEAQR